MICECCNGDGTIYTEDCIIEFVYCGHGDYYENREKIDVKILCPHCDGLGVINGY